MKKFVKERNEAFTAAVMNDDWDKVKRYAKKYGIPLPEKEKVMKAGVYKAVQECTDINEEVKVTAMVKCIKLGFRPFIGA